MKYYHSSKWLNDKQKLLSIASNSHIKPVSYGTNDCLLQA